MGNIISKPRGTVDLFGISADRYQDLVLTLDRAARCYGALPIAVPTFEESKLFKRGVGESTDIVNKETFDLAPKGDHSYTLRPEFTAGITRAVIENKLYASPDLPLKFYYSGSAFRYERPQAGRLREFHQWGVEFLDADLDLSTTAEAIALMVDQAKMLGIKPQLKINYLGSAASRARYRAALVDYFEPHIDAMCEDCRHRLKTNPLRILDCKVIADHPLVEQAPAITDFLDHEDQESYHRLLAILEALGIEYLSDNRLVRGLDYYTGVVFELCDESQPELGALGGGGRYDGLMKTLGGPEFAGVGFSFGLERLLLALADAGEKTPGLDLLLLDLSRGAEERELAVIKHDLRLRGLRVAAANCHKALGGALKMADRLKARFFLFKDESGYHLKDLSSREQHELGTELLIEKLLVLIGGKNA